MMNSAHGTKQPVSERSYVNLRMAIAQSTMERAYSVALDWRMQDAPLDPVGRASGCCPDIDRAHCGLFALSVTDGVRRHSRGTHCTPATWVNGQAMDHEALAWVAEAQSNF